MLNSQDNNINRCWSCQKPHAKRKCIATNSFICSLCCGSKRKRRINCPDDCPYIIKAKQQWLEKLSITPSQFDFWRSHFDIIHNIEYTILTVKNLHHDLTDVDVKEALENLIKTSETELRGIIYEYKSSNYRIQLIIDSAQNIINQHRHIKTTSKLQSAQQPVEQKLRKVDLEEIISSLKFILELTRQSINKNISKSYFDFLDLFTNKALVEETS
jgi:hypothetical protein